MSTTKPSPVTVGDWTIVRQPDAMGWSYLIKLDGETVTRYSFSRDELRQLEQAIGQAVEPRSLVAWLEADHDR